MTHLPPKRKARQMLEAVDRNEALEIAEGAADRSDPDSVSGHYWRDVVKHLREDSE